MIENENVNIPAIVCVTYTAPNIDSIMESKPTTRSDPDLTSWLRLNSNIGVCNNARPFPGIGSNEALDALASLLGDRIEAREKGEKPIH